MNAQEIYTSNVHDHGYGQQDNFMGSLFSRSPSLSRCLQWLRGPGKEVSLPHPIPWLQISLTFQNRTQSFPLEHLIIRATRRFTSPVLLAILIITYIISLAFFARAQVRPYYSEQDHTLLNHPSSGIKPPPTIFLIAPRLFGSKIMAVASMANYVHHSIQLAPWNFAVLPPVPVSSSLTKGPSEPRK
jgi:hypothetical protein